MAVHKQIAALTSVSPSITGQHTTEGSPRCISPVAPRSPTQAPSLSVSMGQVSGGGEAGGVAGVVGVGGQTVEPAGGVPVTGGRTGVTGGRVGMTGGMVMGGFPMTGGSTGTTGGRVIGGLTTGGLTTTGGCTGTTGGRVIGGLPMIGGSTGTLGLVGGQYLYFFLFASI